MSFCFKSIGACVTAAALMYLVHLVFSFDRFPFGDEKAARAEIARQHQKDLAARRARIASLRAKLAAVEAKLGEPRLDGFGNILLRPDHEELTRRRSDLTYRLESEQSDLRVQEALRPETWPLVPDQNRTSVEFPRGGFRSPPRINMIPD